MAIYLYLHLNLEEFGLRLTPTVLLFSFIVSNNKSFIAGMSSHIVGDKIVKESYVGKNWYAIDGSFPYEFFGENL